MRFIAMHTQSHEHDDCFGFREVARYTSQLYEPHRPEVDVTPTQFSIMHATERWDSSTMVKLTPAMMMAVVDARRSVAWGKAEGELSHLGHVLPHIAKGPSPLSFWLVREEIRTASRQ